MLKAIKSWLYFKAGVAKIKAGKHTDAIADFDEAIRLKPDVADAYYFRGWVKNQLDEIGPGIADLDEAIHLKPDFANAYYLRGTLKAQCGVFDAGIADLDEAIRLKPNLADAYAVRDLAVGLTANLANLEKSLQLQDDQDNADTPPGSFGEFMQRLHNKNEQSKHDNPSMYHLATGAARHMAGENEAAIVELNTAIQLNPEYTEAYAVRGAANLDLGNLTEAVADYYQALRLPPPANADDFRGAALLYSGQAKAMLEKYESAIIDLDEVMGLLPNNATAYFYRGLSKCGVGEYGVAKTDFDKAMELATRAGNKELQEKIRNAIEVLMP